MSSPQQPELPLKVRPSAKSKVFRGANGFELSYSQPLTNKIRHKSSLWRIVELSDGTLVPVTREGPGPSGRPRLYANVPGHGDIQGRNFKGLLAQLALIDQIRALNKSIQIKLKQQDDAARTLSGLARDNAADLEQENARLREEFESLRRAQPAGGLKAKAGRWTNTLALQWALDQDDLPTGTKAVLVTFAAHANEGGESWPSVQLIASKWKMDRDTVRAAVRHLIANKLITDTGKKAGTTGQVKVYRLPEGESGGRRHRFDEDEAGGEAGDKRRITGGEFAPNKEHRIGEELLAIRQREQTHFNTSQNHTETEKATRWYAEERLLGLLSVIVGPSEILKNPMWRARIKMSPRAIIGAMKKYWDLSPEKRAQIRNRAAWITAEYAKHGGRSVAKASSS